MDAGKSGSPTNCHEQPDYSKRIQKARELLMRIAEEDGLKDRSGPLALLELEKRIRAKGMPTGAIAFLSTLFPPLNCNEREE